MLGRRWRTPWTGQATPLLPDDREQLTLAKRIESDGLSVRDVERIVGEKLASDEPGPRPAKAKRTRTEQTASLEQEFRLALGVKDTYDTADLPTGLGSPIYAGNRPVADASLVALATKPAHLVEDVTRAVIAVVLLHP